MSVKKRFKVNRARDRQQSTALLAPQMPKQIDPLAYQALQHRMQLQRMQQEQQGIANQFEQQRVGLSQQDLQQRSSESQQRILASQAAQSNADRAYGLHEKQFGYQQQSDKEKQRMAMMQFLATIAMNQQKQQQMSPYYQARTDLSRASAEQAEIMNEGMRNYQRGQSGQGGQQLSETELRMRQELMKGK